MRPATHQCPTCDTLLTRAAVVVLAYRRCAAALHRAMNHAGDWQACTDDVCYKHRYDSEQAGYERSK